MPTVAVVGATGYAGAELVSILRRHPEVTLTALTGSSRTEPTVTDLADLHPRLRGGDPLPLAPLDPEAIVEAGTSIVMLATPHEASAELAPWFLDRGLTVLDLSAAFRLSDPAAYPTHYGFDHPRPDLLADAVYGLAELDGAAIAAASLVAVPGCYPTSVILPIRPLVEAGLVDAAEPVIVDATSGVSGAGRAAKPHTSYCEVSLQAYGALSHRHQPEMIEHAGVPVMFTPHLGAFDRGILSTIHVKLVGDATEADARAVLAETYASVPGVQVLAPGIWPSVGAVRQTNRCDIGLAAAPMHSRLLVSSAIDNLVKGAAGQAVQCLNLKAGLPIDLALAPSAISGVVR